LTAESSHGGSHSSGSSIPAIRRASCTSGSLSPHVFIRAAKDCIGITMRAASSGVGAAIGMPLFCRTALQGGCP
jgi:hypothetical protein